MHEAEEYALCTKFFSRMYRNSRSWASSRCIFFGTVKELLPLRHCFRASMTITLLKLVVVISFLVKSRFIYLKKKGIQSDEYIIRVLFSIYLLRQRMSKKPLRRARGLEKQAKQNKFSNF